jgi:hypothetical protein
MLYDPRRVGQQDAGPDTPSEEEPGMRPAEAELRGPIAQFHRLFYDTTAFETLLLPAGVSRSGSDLKASAFSGEPTSVSTYVPARSILDHTRW